MKPPYVRTSNLHRAAGGYAEELMAELQTDWRSPYTITGKRLKEYLRSAYLRGYEDCVKDQDRREGLQNESA